MGPTRAGQFARLSSGPLCSLLCWNLVAQQSVRYDEQQDVQASRIWI